MTLGLCTWGFFCAKHGGAGTVRPCFAGQDVGRSDVSYEEHWFGSADLVLTVPAVIKMRGAY